MKKSVLIIAVAIATVACSRTYDVNPASDPEIGFGTWAENLTKARTQGSSTFAEGDDFAVYGYKLNSSAQNVVFNDVTVTKGADSWSYSPKRYWDQSATSYTFYAVSPAAIGTAMTEKPVVADGNGLNTGDGTMTSASISFAGNDNDILVANETTVENATFTASTVPAVTLHFNHIASLVDFKVKKHSELAADTDNDANTNTVVSITAFQLNNIDNVGTFEITGYSSNLPTATWTATARRSYDYDDDLSTTATTSTYPTNIAATVANASYLIDSLVVMPQTFRSDANIQTAHIEYTITDEAGISNAFSGDLPLHKFDTTDPDPTDKDNTTPFVGSWAAGKHYTFYITINANAIEFTADITDWTTDDATGHYYLVQ